LAASGTPDNDVEFCILTRTGDEKWGAISWQSIADDDGVCMGFRTSVRDISERKQLEKQIRDYAENLERLVRERTARLMELENRRAKVDRLAALGQLAAGVAHEINNPLAGIRSAVELIRDSLPIDFEELPLIEMVQSEIDRIGGIVRQLYQLHRPRPASEGDFDLTAMASQTTQLLAGPCRRHLVTINVLANDGKPILVHLPEGELKQVLYNILHNAIQASPVGGQIDMTLSEALPNVEIRVTDYGAGIPTDIVRKIFDPFFTTKHGTLETGMGLGLSVSQSLVQAMRGQIDVVTQVGKGTTFKITLPRRLEEARESSTQSPGNLMWPPLKEHYDAFNAP
jgi:two-component system, sporulation sensor kinase C